MLTMCFICHSCGKKVEFEVEEPPCKALAEWLTVSHWKGMASVDRYSFCSLSCLQRWVETQVPKIPEVFLKYLEDGNDKE
jgi:hypothetical protein